MSDWECFIKTMKDYEEVTNCLLPPKKCQPLDGGMGRGITFQN